jgi:hypothetical protein
LDIFRDFEDAALMAHLLYQCLVSIHAYDDSLKLEGATYNQLWKTVFPLLQLIWLSYQMLNICILKHIGFHSTLFNSSSTRESCCICNLMFTVCSMDYNIFTNSTQRGAIITQENIGAVQCLMTAIPAPTSPTVNTAVAEATHATATCAHDHPPVNNAKANNKSIMATGDARGPCPNTIN